MPVAAPRSAARSRPVPVASLASLLACAVLAVAALVSGWPLLASAPVLACGLLVGRWLGRRELAAAATQLVDAAPTSHPAGGLLRAGLSDGGALTASPVGVPMPPDMPELRPLAAGIRTLLARQQALFSVQAEQLEQLRQQAHNDPLTGLANRRHFMAMLDSLLDGRGGLGDTGLVLLRVRDLQSLNQRIGHAAADHALLAIASCLQTYTDRIAHCVAGRLNGADFALLLPVAGMADETAGSLVQAMRLPLAAIDPMARVCAGAAELGRPVTAHQALAQVDAALARAEAEADGAALATPPPADLPAVDAALPQGQAAWQRRIVKALDQGHVALGAFAVRTADGRQLHLDCPLRLQLSAEGAFEPASRWLSMATRSRLCAEVDERAVALALAAIAEDGVARCINVAGQSAGSAEFVAMVARRLERAPEAACRLWLDLPETLALERPLLVREVSRRWRPLGAMVGLEHAGDGLAHIPHLIDLGLDCVRIDGRFVNNIAGPGADAARRHLQGLVRLVQAVGLQVTAEAVRSAEDLEVLWQLGFDAATGPALVAADEVVAPA